MSVLTTDSDTSESVLEPSEASRSIFASKKCDFQGDRPLFRRLFLIPDLNTFYCKEMFKGSNAREFGSLSRCSFRVQPLLRGSLHATVSSAHHLHSLLSCLSEAVQSRNSNHLKVQELVTVASAPFFLFLL